MRKLVAVLGFALLAIGTVGDLDVVAAHHGFGFYASCKTTGTCNACKNCRYCKPCAKQGKTCSVCR